MSRASDFNGHLPGGTDVRVHMHSRSPTQRPPALTNMYPKATNVMGIIPCSQPAVELESDDCAESRHSLSSCSSASSAARRHYRPREYRRGPWSEAEDQALIDIVSAIGPYDWASVCKKVRGRNSKQCRERWFQNLRPDLDHTSIRPEEAEIIEEMYAACGPKWAEIARALGSRSDNAVKNWWNGNQNRKKRKERDRARTGSRMRAQVHAPTLTDSSAYPQSIPASYRQPQAALPAQTSDHYYYDQYYQHQQGHMPQAGTHRPETLPSPVNSDSTERSQYSYTLSPANHHTSSYRPHSHVHPRPILPPPHASGLSGLCASRIALPGPSECLDRRSGLSSGQSDIGIPRTSTAMDGPGGEGREVCLPPIQTSRSTDRSGGQSLSYLPSAPTTPPELALLPDESASRPGKAPHSTNETDGRDPRLSVSSLLR